MKQFVLLFTIMLGITVSSNGQTYLEHLQKKTPGLGTVTVTQSKAIDELINGKKIPQDDKTIPTTTPTKHNTPDNQKKTSENQKKTLPDSVKRQSTTKLAMKRQFHTKVRTERQTQKKKKKRHL